MFKKFRRFFGLFLCSIFIALILNTNAQAESHIFKKPITPEKKGELFDRYSVMYSPSLANSHISIEINSVGTFTMQRASDGKWLLYPYAGTTGFSINVDGNIYYSNDNLQNYVTKFLTVENENTAYIEYTTPEDVLIRQTFELRSDSKAVLFHVEAINQDNQSHNVEIRYLFDTQIDQNDGSPLYAQGVKDKTGSSICTYETNISNMTFNEWKAYDIWPQPNLTTVGNISSVPDRVVFAWWPDASGSAWNYPLKNNSDIDVYDNGWDPDQPFFRNSGGNSPDDDSCVLMYFDLGPLAPGMNSVIKTYYGIGQPTVASGKDKFLNAVAELNGNFSSWLQYLAERNVDLFTQGLGKVRSAQGQEKARAVVGMVSAGFSLATSGGATQILSSGIDNLMGVYGVSRKTAQAIYYLAEMNKYRLYFNGISSANSGFQNFFNDEVFANSMSTWLRENEDNLTGNWDLYGDNSVYSNFYSFLWSDVRWSEDDNKPTGMNGLAISLSKNNTEWADSLCLLADSEYPFEEVADKIQSVSQAFQQGQINPVMVVWLNEEGTDMELGNLRIWEQRLEAAIEDFDNANFWSWAGTITSVGLAIGKVALIPVTGGLSSAALIAEVCITGASIAVAAGQTYWDLMEQAPANDKLADETKRVFMAGQQEAKNAENGINYLRGYLKYENIDQLISDANTDNTQLTINDFNIDNYEVDDGNKKEFTENEVLLKAQNNGSQQIPVTSYVIFYAKKADGSIEGPVNILFHENDYLQYLSNSEIQIDYEKAELFTLETLNAEYYLACGYLAAGPSLISKIYGPVIDTFTITEEPGLLDSVVNFVTGDDQPEIEEGEVHTYNYTGSNSSVFSHFTLTYPGSDLDLHVYDANGNHVGVNYANGEIENQIPGASYSRSSANPEWIRVPHANGYDYQIKTVGLETEGAERYEIIATDVPDRPAIMGISPNTKEVSVDKDILDNIKLHINVNEMGGQRSIKDLSASVTELTSNGNAEIPSEDIQIILSDHAIPAAGSIDIVIEISNLGNIDPGTYEGILNVRGCQGSITQARMCSMTPFSSKTLNAINEEVINKSATIIININQSTELVTGWNLISFNLQPDDTSVEAILSSIEGKYSSVWSYQSGTWKVYNPANPGFSDLSIMKAGLGYWINMDEAATLPINGSQPSSSIDLSEGWNLVGYNSSTSQPIADVLASIAGKVVSVWAYINGEWKVYDPANPGFSDLMTMEPGYGYWIVTTEACTWTLP